MDNASRGRGSGRLEWLDLFRGLMAVLVVMFHFAEPLGLRHMSFGLLAVDLFFVLSGIVLAVNYADRIRSGMSFREFAWHRLRRLYPMVLLASGTVLALNALGAPEGQYVQGLRQGAWHMLIVVPQLKWDPVLNAFPADAPMWSLWAELAANVVWFACLRRGPRTTLVVLAAAFVMMLGLAVHNRSLNFGFWSGYMNMIESAVRALAWFGVGYYIGVKRPRPFVPVWAGCLGLAAAAAAIEAHFVNGLLFQIAFVLAGALLLVRLMSVASGGGTMSRICRGLGDMSYPLYLIHVPAGRVAEWLVDQGYDGRLAFIAVIAAFAVVATVLNEQIVRHLPTRLGRQRQQMPAN